MSHFTVLVITGETEIEEGRKPEELVEGLLAPYQKRYAGFRSPCREWLKDEWFEEGTHWDWYAIGGRWEGDLAADYEPSDDPRNYSPCDLCNGTNVRSDTVGVEQKMVEKQYCNGCTQSDAEKAKDLTLSDGTKLFGMSRNFSNAPTNKNVMLVKDIRKDFQPHAYVTPEDGWVESSKMLFWAATTDENPEYEEAQKAAFEKYANRVAVLVDCHI